MCFYNSNPSDNNTDFYRRPESFRGWDLVNNIDPGTQLVLILINLKQMNDKILLSIFAWFANNPTSLLATVVIISF